MKKVLSFLLLLMLSISLSAQSERYAEFMKKNMAQLDSAKTTDDLQNAANNFDRIANAEKDQWQPYYYAAYAMVMKSFYTKDKNQVDGFCSKADEYLAIAESLSPENSEITTLKSMVLSARMTVDNSRYMTLGPKSGQLLQQAVQQKPVDNPRALMQLAQSKYYTPPAFGGGKEIGIDVLKKSLAAYDTFKPASEFDPNWGKAYAQQLLTDWSK